MSSSPALSLAREHPALTLAAAFALALLLYAVRALPALPDVVTQLALPDTDDAMRLIRVRDWLAGQAWFDTGQHRVLPPGGIRMHWSRLVDVPIAGLVLALRPFLGPALADGVAAALWPALLFGAYLTLLAVGARRLFGTQAAALALVVAVTVPDLAGIFVPGRIDHHNVQAILILGLALGLAWPDRPARARGLAGLCAGLSLVVGLETLPVVALGGVAAVVGWIAGDDRRGLAAFGAGLAGSSLAGFLVQTDPALWGRPVCDALSPPILVMSVGGGLAAVLLGAIGGRIAAIRARLAAAGFVGAALGLLVAVRGAGCLTDPYAILPPEARTYWLDLVREALPLWKSFGRHPEATLGLIGPFLAAVTLAVLATRRPGPDRRVLGLLAAFLALGVALSLVQVRTTRVPAAVLPLLAGALLVRIWPILRDESAEGGRRALAALGALLLFTPAWVAVGTAVPVRAAAPPSLEVPACARPAALAWLDRLSPATVLADVDLGPGIMLQSRHAVVSAPYTVEGIVLGIAAFRGDEARVRAVMRRTGASLFLVCPDYLSAYGPEPTFARALLAGAQAPWLERVPDAPVPLWRVVE